MAETLQIETKFEGADRFMKAIHRVRDTVKPGMHKALLGAGTIIQADVRNQLRMGPGDTKQYVKDKFAFMPPNPTEHLRMLRGNRPGGLFGSVEIRDVSVEKVQVGSANVAARIHEKGGDIYPKNKPYLIFRLLLEGKPATIFSKHVHIPARPYFRPGVKAAKPKVEQLFRNTLAQVEKDATANA